jgi:hypothetical protein
LAEGITIVEAELAKMGQGWFDGLNVLLGSLGVDAFDPIPDLGEELAKLTPEQADDLDAELQKLADFDAEVVEAEVVEGGGAGVDA